MLIYGAGGHAKVIISIAQSQGLEVKGIFDDAPPGDFLKGYPVFSKYASDFLPQEALIIAIGDNRQRKQKEAIIQHSFASLIHSSALVNPDVRLGSGTVVLPRAIIQTDVQIGRQVIINTAVLLEHDCLIEDYVHLAPRATLCGGVSVGEGSLIGAASVILPNVKIGQWARVGAGAVVTRDVPDHSTVAGNPARIISA